MRLNNHSYCTLASANNSVLQKCNAHIKLIQCYIFWQTSRANSAGRARANPVFADDFTRSARTFSVRPFRSLFVSLLAMLDRWFCLYSGTGLRFFESLIFYVNFNGYHLHIFGIFGSASLLFRDKIAYYKYKVYTWKYRIRIVCSLKYK